MHQIRMNFENLIQVAFEQMVLHDFTFLQWLVLFVFRHICVSHIRGGGVNTGGALLRQHSKNNNRIRWKRQTLANLQNNDEWIFGNILAVLPLGSADGH